MSISTFSLRLLTFFAFTSDVKTTVGVRHESSMSVQMLEGGALLGNETYSTNQSEQNNTIGTCGDVEGATETGNMEKIKNKGKKCKCKGYSQSAYCGVKKIGTGRYFNVGTLTGNDNCYCSADALVVIDVQNCFTDGHTNKNGNYVRVESGRGEDDTGLQSDRGNKEWKKSVVAYVEKWIKRGRNIVLLQDFHDDDHVSFITGNETPWNPIDNLRNRKMDPATYWYSNDGTPADNNSKFEKTLEYVTPVFPKHCVKGKEESKLVDGLCEAVGGKYEGFACTVNPEIVPNVKVVQKGKHGDIDSFGGIYDNRLGYITELAEIQDDDLARRASWGVLEWLNGKNVKSVEAIGIADDYCVKTTVLDLANKGKAKKLKKSGVQAIPMVEVNPQYTYGIVASLGAWPVLKALKADLKKGGVKVRFQEASV